MLFKVGFNIYLLKDGSLLLDTEFLKDTMLFSYFLQPLDRLISKIYYKCISKISMLIIKSNDVDHSKEKSA